MDCCQLISGRRNFLKGSVMTAAGIAGLGLAAEPSHSDDAEMFIVGPKKGYSPQIGTLVSMMAFMRWQVLHSVKDMSIKDLDFLLDEKANRIGALLLHLVAVERFYQLNTFEGVGDGKMPEAWKEQWGPAMELGDGGRKAIQGHDLDFYLNQLNETREKTLALMPSNREQLLSAAIMIFIIPELILLSVFVPSPSQQMQRIKPMVMLIRH